jgi:hypothetical protein
MTELATNLGLPKTGKKWVWRIQNLLGMRQGSMARTIGDTSLGIESDS